MKNKYKDTSSDWLYFAKTDLKVAKLVLKEKIYNMVCFHSQQAVEKSMKAFLRHKGKKAPKIHRLITLLILLEKEGVKRIKPKEISFLDKFYTPTRYPDMFVGSLPEGLPSKNDAEKTLKIAEKIFKLLQKLITKVV